MSIKSNFAQLIDKPSVNCQFQKKNSHALVYKGVLCSPLLKLTPLQIEEMQKYVSRRQWTTTLQIEEVESGAKDRPKRDLLIQVARKRNIDVILVWRLDRWG